MAAQKPVTPEYDLPALEDVVGPDAESEMTAAEIERTEVHLNLLKTTSFLSGSKSITSEDVDRCLSEIEEWLASKSKYLSASLVSDTAISLESNTPSAPSWKYFHETFTIFESLKAIYQLASVSSRKAPKSAKLPKDRIEKLVDLAREIYESIRSTTRTLKSHISESGMLSTLIDLVLTGKDGNEEEGKQLRTELENTLDIPALELFCGSLMESWEEALDGVLGVTL